MTRRIHLLASLALAGSLAGCGLMGDDDEEIEFAPLPPAQVVKERLTEQELLEICNDLVMDGQTKAQKAQQEVQALQAELAAKEAALADYKAQEIKDESKRAEAVKRWRQMESEIQTLQERLVSAETERDRLRDDLKNTLVELDRQIAETKKFKEKATVYRRKAIHYKAESTRNLWSSFVNGAKVEICDKGSRKRHEKCHEAVEQAFTADVESKFVECVDTYQAVPELRQLGKNDPLPSFASTLPDDNKFTRKGWVVVYCDPSLPEAGDKLLEQPDPELDDPGELPPSRADVLDGGAGADSDL